MVLEDWEEDDDDMEERGRVTWRGVLLVTLCDLVGAGAMALTTLVALGVLGALDVLVLALVRGLALDLGPLGVWEGAAAAVLERGSIVDVYRLSESVWGYLIV